MIYTKRVRDVMIFVNQYYAQHNVVDKGGFPYIHHVLHIAEQMETESACIVALLHDICEDYKTLPYSNLRTEELKAIKILAKTDDENYDEYIRRVGENELATTVKLVDLLHNLNGTRLLKDVDYYLSSEIHQQRRLKYIKAYEYLYYKSKNEVFKF